MVTEQTIAEIEWLERIFAVPDARPHEQQGKLQKVSLALFS